MKANLKDVNEQGDFEAIPIGWQHVDIVKSEEIKKGHEDHKEGKAPYIKVWFKVVEGIYVGRYLFHNFIFTEKALGFMKPFLLAIGYPEENVDIQPVEWLHEQLMVLVDHEIFNGKTKEKTVGYKLLESVGKTQIETDDEEIPF